MPCSTGRQGDMAAGRCGRTESSSPFRLSSGTFLSGRFDMIPLYSGGFVVFPWQSAGKTQLVCVKTAMLVRRVLFAFALFDVDGLKPARLTSVTHSLSVSCFSTSAYRHKPASNGHL